MYTIEIDDLYQLVIVPFANTSELLTIILLLSTCTVVMQY